MKRDFLFKILFVVTVLFCVDRAVAYIHKPKPDSKEIVLYTTEWCPYCNSLRKHLNNHNIEFKEYDIEKSLSGIAGFWALRIRGVPVSVIGPEVVYGYDIDKINLALIQLGHDINNIENYDNLDKTP